MINADRSSANFLSLRVLLFLIFLPLLLLACHTPPSNYQHWKDYPETSDWDELSEFDPQCFLPAAITSVLRSLHRRRFSERSRRGNVDCRGRKVWMVRQVRKRRLKPDLNSFSNAEGVSQSAGDGDGSR